MNKLYVRKMDDGNNAMLLQVKLGILSLCRVSYYLWNYPDKRWLTCGIVGSPEDNGFTLLFNNYQRKQKCSQPGSRLSSCHASETTAKSRGLLSRLYSVFSSNAKK